MRQWKAVRVRAAGQLRGFLPFLMRLLRPTKPVLVNAASIPLTVAGWGCIAAAVFTWNVTAGLAVLGGVLMVLEHQIADEK